jgi:uncharacterized protein YgbK (DUF1537 family)
VGSIGCAIEIAQDTLDSQWIPILIAAPKMRRYQSFGHLFAADGDDVYRIDRHPTMAHHPVTPIHESDVAKHIMLQSAIPIGSLTIEEIETDPVGCLKQKIKGGKQVITLDATCDQHMGLLGELMWNPEQKSLFTVGSQGIEYALVQHWRENDLIEKQDFVSSAGSVEQVICVSGSLSPHTSEQINWAEKNGFHGISIDVGTMLSDPSSVSDKTVEKALSVLQSQQSPIVHTANAPKDLVSNLTPEQSSQVGRVLGQILKRLLKQTDIRRAIISGGDTSGHASQQLDLFAFQALSPTVPGASLLRAYSNDPDFEGLELALKGGQMGSHDYFDWIKRGGGTA